MTSYTGLSYGDFSAGACISTASPPPNADVITAFPFSAFFRLSFSGAETQSEVGWVSLRRRCKQKTQMSTNKIVLSNQKNKQESTGYPSKIEAVIFRFLVGLVDNPHSNNWNHGDTNDRHEPPKHLRPIRKCVVAHRKGRRVNDVEDEDCLQKHVTSRHVTRSKRCDWWTLTMRRRGVMKVQQTHQ